MMVVVYAFAIIGAAVVAVVLGLLGNLLAADESDAGHDEKVA